MKIFGYDIGRSSIGEALVEDSSFLKAPVSVILPGETAKERRGSRGQRRHIRRASRLRKRAWSTLQEQGILPHETYCVLVEQAHVYAQTKGFQDDPFIFYLRTCALDERVPVYILGLCLYNLVHHRGFYYELDDELRGETAKASDNLVKEMEQVGARTMGEYVFKTGKHVYGRRSRGREHVGGEPKFFSHTLVKDEFNRIMDKQAEFYPNLTDLKESLVETLFSVRPLRSVKGDLEWRVETDALVDVLPPVSLVLKNVRNPMVIHVLSELRRIINVAISRHGKPDKFILETADGGIETTEEAKERIANKVANGRIKKILEKEGKKTTPDEVRKARLLEEQRFVCPLCGKNIGAADPVDLCHIIPESEGGSRRYENIFVGHSNENGSQSNRALCDLPNYQKILAIIDSFGDAKKSKIARLRRDEWDGFVASALCDTQIIVKLAKEYVGMLGRPVETINGHVTATFRKALGIEKDREDLRHHGIDAAMLIMPMSSYFEYKKTGKITPPWPSFKGDLMRQDFRVIHRPPTHQLRGALHKATFYPASAKHDAVLSGKRCVLYGNNYAAVVESGKRIKTLSLMEVVQDKSLAQPREGQQYVKVGDIFRRLKDNTQWRVTSLKRTSNQISVVATHYGGEMPASTVVGVREQPSLGPKFFKGWICEKSDY